MKTQETQGRSKMTAVEKEKNKPRTFKEFLEQMLGKNGMRELASQGDSNGFQRFLYAGETVSLYERFHEEIWEELNRTANETGHTLIEQVGDIAKSWDISDHASFANALVCWTAGTTARKIVGETTKGGIKWM